jgi:WD40 repeat protein
MAYSPDGKVLAVGASDKTVTLWNPATGSAFAGPIQNSTSAQPGDGVVTSMTFSPDGDTLSTGATDGMINLWSVPLFTDAYTALCADLGPLSPKDWNMYAPGEPQPTTCL